MADLAPLTALNRAIRDNDVAEVTRQLSGEPALRAIECAPGVSRWEWDVTESRLINPFGLVRGGCLSIVADAAMSSAIGAVLDDGELATTAELKISFLRAAKPGLLRAEGRVVQKGRRLAFLETQIRDARGELVATVTSTWTVMRAD
ncbi:MAG: PaaI family thioesterase [Deltaproteobacteria bacterium]|nr:PaaI family thioesterase [Deltaproteobacteria bacterium]